MFLNVKYLYSFTDGVDILTKKKLFDHVMLASRLEEEKQILVKEMLQHCQHCQYLKDSPKVAKVQTLTGTVLVSTQTGSKCKLNYLATCTFKCIGPTI